MITRTFNNKIMEEQSLRKQVLEIPEGGTLLVPIERYEYVTSLIYRLGAVHKRKYSARNNGEGLLITRVS